MQRLIGACYMGTWSLGVTKTILGPMVAIFQTRYDLSLSSVGAIFLFQFAGSLIGSAFGGILADALGTRRVILGGLAVLAGGLLGFAVSPAWWLTLVLAWIVGLGYAVFNVSAITTVSRLHADRPGPALNRLTFCFGLGAVMGPLLFAAAVSGPLGWRGLYILLALTPLAVLVGVRHCTFPKAGRPFSLSDARHLAVKARFRLPAALLFLYVGIETGIAGWIYTYMEGHFGYSSAGASWVLSLFWVGLTAGRFACAWLVDRFGYAATIVWSAALSAAAAAAIAIYPGATGTAVLFVCVGLFFSGIFPTALALAGQSFPGQLGAVSGLLVALGGLGSTFIPWTMGFAGDLFGLRTGFALAALGTVAMVAFAIRWRREGTAAPAKLPA